MKKNMVRFLLLIALFLVSSTVFAEETLIPAEGIPLFEGKTIADFDCYLADGGKKEDVYRLEDGILKVSGNPFGWLSPKGTFKNFILETDLSYPTSNPTANSGIFLRLFDSADRPEPLFLPPCIECQLQTQNIGHLFGFHGHTLLGDASRYTYRARSEADGKIKPELHKLLNVKNAQKEGWNHLKIVCFEDLVVVFLNDQPVNWACNVQNSEGRIGFQSEGGEIWFKNAVLKPVSY